MYFCLYFIIQYFSIKPGERFRAIMALLLVFVGQTVILVFVTTFILYKEIYKEIPMKLPTIKIKGVKV